MLVSSIHTLSILGIFKILNEKRHKFRSAIACYHIPVTQRQPTQQRTTNATDTNKQS